MAENDMETERTRGNRDRLQQPQPEEDLSGVGVAQNNADNPLTYLKNLKPLEIIDISPLHTPYLTYLANIKPLEIIDISPLHIPYDPLNPEANAARASILNGEPDPKQKKSLTKTLSPKRILSELLRPKRFKEYLDQYERILKLRGTPQTEIDQTRARAEKEYNDHQESRSQAENNIRTDLDTLSENTFSILITQVKNLMIDAEVDKEVIEEFKSKTNKEFYSPEKRTKRGERIEILEGLTLQRNTYLVTNYETYLKIWQTLSPNGVDLANEYATFKQSSPEEQITIAKDLYEKVSRSIIENAHGYALQLRQLSIDLGMPFEEAEIETLNMVNSAREGSIRDRSFRMEEIRSQTEGHLLRTFSTTMELYRELNGENGEKTKEIEDTFNSPGTSLEAKLKMAQKYYRKVERALEIKKKSILNALFIYYNKRKNYLTPEANFEIHEKEAMLSRLTRQEQLKLINNTFGWLKVHPFF